MKKRYWIYDSEGTLRGAVHTARPLVVLNRNLGRKGFVATPVSGGA